MIRSRITLNDQGEPSEKGASQQDLDGIVLA